MQLNAATFPDAVDGVVTITAGTYDEGTLPASAKLVKTGPGEAIIAVDSPDFAGETEVREGTLTLTTHAALGPVGKDATGGDVAVLDGATLCLAWPGVRQNESLWTRRTVSVAGTGVGGAGAIRVEPSTSGSLNDRLFGTLRLTGDARISAMARWGFDGALEMNGHTLTHGGAGGTMVYLGKFVGPGNVIAEGNGTFLQSVSFEGFDGEDVARTFTVLPKVNVTLWQVKNPIPFDFTLRGGKDAAGNFLTPGRLYPTSGASRELNVITGNVTLPEPAELNNAVYELPSAATGTYMTWAGKTVQNSLLVYRVGTLVLSGPFEGAATPSLTHARRLQLASGGNLVVADGADMRNVNPYVYGDGGSVLIEGGSLSLTGFNLSETAGSLSAPARMTGGQVTLSSDLRVVGGGRLGSFYLDGGEFVYSNALYTCINPDGVGFLVQRGGRLAASEVGGVTCFGILGRSVFCQDGGTNETAMANGWGSVCLGRNPKKTAEAGEQTLSIRGAGTLFKTDRLRFDDDDLGDRSLNLSVSDGGVLSVRRLFRSISRTTETAHRHDTSLYFDGGVLEIRQPNGLVDVEPSSEDFYSRDPDRLVVGPKGLVFDTAACTNADAGPVYATIPFDFSKPVGKGLARITLPETDDFRALAYKGPAWIAVDGDGVGAAAFADWDFATSSLVVRITNPGCGYTAEKTTVRILSPDLTAWHACGFELEEQASGPVEVRGAGGVALYGTNTFAALVVSKGSRLRASGARSVPAGVDATVRGTLDVMTNDVTVASLAGDGAVEGSTGRVTLSAGGEIRVRVSELLADGATPLRVNVPLTLSEGAKVVVEDPENLPERIARRPFLCALNGLDIAGTSLPEVVDASGASLKDRVAVRRCADGGLRLGSRQGIVLYVR